MEKYEKWKYPTLETPLSAPQKIFERNSLAYLARIATSKLIDFNGFLLSYFFFLWQKVVGLLFLFRNVADPDLFSFCPDQKIRDNLQGLWDEQNGMGARSSPTGGTCEQLRPEDEAVRWISADWRLLRQWPTAGKGFYCGSRRCLLSI